VPKNALYHITESMLIISFRWDCGLWEVVIVHGVRYALIWIMIPAGSDMAELRLV